MRKKPFQWAVVNNHLEIPNVNMNIKISDSISISNKQPSLKRNKETRMEGGGGRDGGVMWLDSTEPVNWG